MGRVGWVRQKGDRGGVGLEVSERDAGWSCGIDKVRGSVRRCGGHAPSHARMTNSSSSPIVSSMTSGFTKMGVHSRGRPASVRKTGCTTPLSLSLSLCLPQPRPCPISNPTPLISPATRTGDHLLLGGQRWVCFERKVADCTGQRQVACAGRSAMQSRGKGDERDVRRHLREEEGRAGAHAVTVDTSAVDVATCPDDARLLDWFVWRGA